MLETKDTKSDKGVQTGAMSMAPLVKEVFGIFEGISAIVVDPTELIMDTVPFGKVQVAKKPVGIDQCTCPNCGTFNEVISKRRNTVKQDVVYCWHCGQAIKINRGDVE